MSRIVLDTETEARFRQDWLNTRVLVKQMVARYGHTNDTLRRIACDLGLTEREDDVWTPDVFADVKRRYEAGESPTEIAKSKGMTRNQVVSKLGRCGLLRARREPKAPILRTPRRAPEPRSVIAAAAPKLEPVRQALPTFIRAGGCQWPHGDPLEPGFHHCGGKIMRGSYCEGHAKRAYQPSPPPKPRPYDARGG